MYYLRICGYKNGYQQGFITFPVAFQQIAASLGDGYKGRRSPHTPHEKFEGLTVLRAFKVKTNCVFMKEHQLCLYNHKRSKVTSLSFSWHRMDY